MWCGKVQKDYWGGEWGSIQRCFLSGSWRVKPSTCSGIPFSNGTDTSRVESYHPDFKNLTIEPEQNFGPLPEALVKHADDEKGGELLKDLWTSIEEDDEKRAEGYEPFEQLD
ncbi:serine threonine protein [Rutstroemia sp. NJR-2017a WRK4]|nr:serine threonine protein [Rutstroemia sp. NJR-2017a WRK4]